MLSFFGDKDKGPNKSGGPVISRVAVKKVVSRPATASPVPLSGSSNLKRSSAASAPPAVRPSSSSQSRNGHGSSSSSLKPPIPKGVISSSRSPVSSPVRKRKTPTPSRIESESESSGSEDDALLGIPSLKRQKSSINGSRGTATTPSYGQVAGEAGGGGGGYGKWALGRVDERGEWGRGWAGFVTSEEAMKGVVKGWSGGKAGAGDGNTKGLDKYVAYFPQEGFDKESMPSVELLYPATGCRERYILLHHNNAREYSPILELRAALKWILKYYIPPSHQAIFGQLDGDFDLDSNPSHISTPMTNIPTPPPDSSSTPPPVINIPSESIGDAIRKALAPNRRDGPGFLRAVERFNTAFEQLQADGSLARWMDKRPGLEWDEWSGLVESVHEHAYSRVVAPYSNELEHHPKHPDEVARAISGKEDAYGELRHKFVTKIIEQTGLGPDSVFVDLGSGVGNCVMQVALQAGSKSHGFELLPVPAHCARLQLREVQRRWAMWGLKGCINVEVHEGDFRTLPSVVRCLREADVVLVNNEVFSPSLNADLTNMFLDLKEGAKIVSLKPFVPESFKMNPANCDSFAAIVKMTQHIYYKDWVSWKGDSGDYYVQVIDRSMRRKFEEEMNGRRGASRA